MMKKYVIFLAAIAILSSCEKNVIGDFENSSELSPRDLAAPIGKKGVAFTNGALNWSYKTSDLKANWMYSWGNTLRDEIPENVEFVPMFWGKGSVTDANIDRIKGLVAEGKVKYVLGFNEPDNSKQSNMTVDEAIALWPRLEEIGVPIGSPATVDPDNNWMKQFMQKAVELGLRVDFVAVHSYGGVNVLNFINKLAEIHETYGRPIWITEFAVADWDATSIEANDYSEGSVVEYMKETLGYLNDIPWIHRYAWFDGGERPPLASSALFNGEANITSLGELYARIDPNNNIGPGQDTVYVPPIDENEILNNGGFEAGTLTPWGGYNNGIVGLDIGPHTGNFAGKVNASDGSLFTYGVVEPGKTYIFKFWSKWSASGMPVMKPVIKDGSGGINGPLLYTFDPLPTSTEWVETAIEYVVPAGITGLRLQFYKVASAGILFYLDDVSLKEKI